MIGKVAALRESLTASAPNLGLDSLPFSRGQLRDGSGPMLYIHTEQQNVSK